MLYIETGSTTPAINLAYEEYFLKGKDLQDDLFMLWRNEPVIVVGRFQNTQEQIHTSYAKARQLKVIRRISGGGAVYHDLGNLCFSFILHDIKPEIIDKSKYAKPLLDAFARLGVHAQITSRNDLTVDGRKFSGNAMALHKTRLLFHGTLLIDTDLEILEKVLQGPEGHIQSKGVKSFRSHVVNLKDFLPTGLDIIQLKQQLIQLLFFGEPYTEYVPNQEDLNAIQNLVETKYNSWEWNFGKNPDSRIQQSFRLPDGNLEIYLELANGVIRTCQLRSDFSKPIDLSELEKRLINVRYTFIDVQNVLMDTDINKNLGSIFMDEFLKAIII
jgi:lipoate-protein ligase A